MHLPEEFMRPDLGYSAACVKPDNQGFALGAENFLNNFYLPVFI
jgi:hypothetical protein